MKCALEIAVAIEVRKEAERIAEEERRRKIFEEQMQKFKDNIEKIDEYVEKQLVASSNGCVELHYGSEWEFYDDERNGFFCFTTKQYYNPGDKVPYWHEYERTPFFHLDTYIEYLKAHCFKVEKIEKPYHAESSTGRSVKEMKGRMLRISI